MKEGSDKEATGFGNQKVTRRAALLRFGQLGIGTAVGAGLLEFLGAGRAVAGTTATRTNSGRIYSPSQTRNIQTLPPGSAVPAGCCVGYLSEGNCGGPCPPGSYCYACTGCGIEGFACLTCDGTETCTYCD